MVETLELSNHQLEILERFRTCFLKELDDEKRNNYMFLLRWLVARDFDFEKARIMLASALKWRRENNINSLREEVFPEDYKVKYPYSFGAFDKDGRPVLIFPLGRWNCREACESGEKESLIRYMDTIFETGQYQCGKSCWTNCPSKSHTQVNILVDMKGFSYWQLAHKKTLESFLELVQHYENYYPETMHRGVIINAPWAFTILFAMMKKIMSMKTLQKVTLCGDDPTEWSSVILELIEANQLPKSFGGTLPELFEYQ